MVNMGLGHSLIRINASYGIHDAVLAHLVYVWVCMCTHVWAEALFPLSSDKGPAHRA